MYITHNEKTRGERERPQIGKRKGEKRRERDKKE